MNPLPTQNTSKLGLFQIVILLLSLLVLCALAFDTIYVLPPEVHGIIQALDTGVCVLFLIDFSVRFYHAESKLAFMKWGWIDLIASIPNLDVLRWGRMVRIFQIIRLLRGIRSVHRVFKIILEHKVKSGAVSLGLTALLLIVFSSISILMCERHGEANIKTAEDAVWWSVTTMTTVGYGDKYPVTTEGRVIGIILMFCGVGLFGGISGMVASIFLGRHEEKHSENKEVLERLDKLQAKLDALSSQQKMQPEHESDNGTGSASGKTL